MPVRRGARWIYLANGFRPGSGIATRRVGMVQPGASRAIAAERQVALEFALMEGIMAASSASPVVGIGGVFLFSEKPDALAMWYAEHLGLTMEHAPQHGAWFARFPYRNLEDDTERYALFTVLTARRRLRREGRQFTVNLRVHDLPDLVERLRAAQVKVTEIEEHPEGRFAWTHDPDGNRLELWEDTAT